MAAPADKPRLDVGQPDIITKHRRRRQDRCRQPSIAGCDKTDVVNPSTAGDDKTDVVNQAPPLSAIE